MPMPSNRSRPTSRIAIARTGVARTKIKLVAYIDQIKSGSRNHVRPGARILCVVTMKFSPVRIEEKPVTKTPTAVVMTYVLE